jgi:carbon monoxide dehydrogenase subunit G
MVDVSVSGVVGAPPDRVFAFLADLRNWPRWQSDMKSVVLVDGEPDKADAVYHYVSKAMGQTITSIVRVVRIDPPREVAFEGEWAGMIRPNGRYLVEAEGAGSRVTLNPHPETRGLGTLLSPLLAATIRRLNSQHLAALQRVFNGD